MCCPRVVFIWPNSWDRVLSPIVTFRNSPRRSSSSKQPVCFNMASLKCVYGSRSGTDSRMSATLATREGGSAETKAENLVAWEGMVWMMQSCLRRSRSLPFCQVVSTHVGVTTCCGTDKYIDPTNYWNISDWQRTRQDWQNKVVVSKGQILLWRIVIGISYGGRRFVSPRIGSWCRILSLVQDWITGARLVAAGTGRWLLVQ